MTPLLILAGLIAGMVLVYGLVGMIPLPKLPPVKMHCDPHNPGGMHDDL